MMNVRAIYEMALRREEEGKRFFEEQAKRLSHAGAVEAFREIAAEEERHIAFVKSLIAGLADTSSVIRPPEEKTSGDFFHYRLESEHVDQSVLEAMVADLPVLRMAYLIEKDMAEFYHDMARKAEGEAREALFLLSEWEIGHRKLFKTLHDQMMVAYERMPWGG